MILSDRTIREQLAAGRIGIDPFDESCIQPSSVDLRLDRLFRVFLNHTMSVIDVRKDLSDLTQEVEIAEGDAFILHPGEFVLGLDLRAGLAARRHRRPHRGQELSLGRLGLLIHSTAGLHRRRVLGAHHARAVQRGQPAHHPLPGHEDRPGELPADDDAGGRALRLVEGGLEVPGPAGPHSQPLLGELRRTPTGSYWRVSVPLTGDGGRGRARATAPAGTPHPSRRGAGCRLPARSAVVEALAPPAAGLRDGRGRWDRRRHRDRRRGAEVRALTFSVAVMVPVTAVAS